MVTFFLTHIISSTLKMETTHFSETLVYNKPTLAHILMVWKWQCVCLESVYYGTLPLNWTSGFKSLMPCNALIDSLIFRQTKTNLITTEKPDVSCSHGAAMCTDSSHSAYGTTKYSRVAHRNKSTPSEHQGKFIYCIHSYCFRLLYVRVHQIELHFFVSKQ
jgi:hypothetical protein